MGIFSRNKTAPAAPAKRKRNLTRAELDAAIESACMGLAADCSTVQTLKQLSFAADNGSDIVTTFNDRFPVSVAELDAAIAETQDAAPSTLSALKRARAILEGENPGKRAEPVQHVTVAQLKAHDAALFDAFSWALGAMASELNRGQPSQAHVLDMLNRSADSPERKKVLSGIAQFREADVRPRTQAEYLRYQSSGRWA